MDAPEKPVAPTPAVEAGLAPPWLEAACAGSVLFFQADLTTGRAFRTGAMYELLGFYPADVPETVEWWAERTHPEDRSQIEEALRREGVIDREYRIQHRDGHYIGVRERSRLLPGGRVLVGVVVDISDQLTERRQAEQAIQQAQQLENLGVLAGGVAHKFNNLLTCILGFTGLVRLEGSHSSPVLGYLEQVDIAAHQAGDVCARMLAYAGKGRFVEEVLDVGEVVREQLDLLQPAWPANTVVSRLLCETTLPVQGDRALIGLAVVNLLTNAVEALDGRPGWVVVRTGQAELQRADLAKLRLGESSSPGQFVYFEVEDTGPGMDEARQKRLFEPFFTTKFLGRGLGLPAVLGIQRSHKGAIAVRSEPGRGSTVRLYWPRGTGEAAGRPKLTAPSWSGQGLVVVVDDEPGVRQFVAAALKRWGYLTAEAGDGAEALAVIESHQPMPRLVLLDLMMPRMDGQRTFDEISARWPGLPVVMMSGFSEEEVGRRFAGRAPAGFLQKPFNADQLRPMVSRLLG